jgi:hypothetical protein
MKIYITYKGYDASKDAQIKYTVNKFGGRAGTGSGYDFRLNQRDATYYIPNNRFGLLKGALGKKILKIEKAN